jgi:hypothetical protein
MIVGTLQEQVAYYQDLLIAEYQNSPRALATIAIYVKQALGDMLAADLDPAFTLETAVGPQLDILGKYIGLSRNIGLPAAQPFFEFSDYLGPVDSPNGFTDYLNPATNAAVIWDNYLFVGAENTALSDAAYLFMLKMQIVLNSNNGTLSSIMEFLETFFPGQVKLIDNKNMTITYYLGAQIPVPPQVLAPYLPRTLGVTASFLNLLSITIPSTIAATNSSPTYPIVTTSATVTAVPTAGTGPYSYQWVWVSGSLDNIVSPGIPQISATAPNSATTAFTYSRGATSYTPAVVTGVFYCIATDSLGIPWVSNQITVTLTANHI